jgi:hypothetical protein
MKEYEKLAREFCRRLERGDKAAEDTAVFYYVEGFLIARGMAHEVWMDSEHVYCDYHNEGLKKLVDLGEKEI